MARMIDADKLIEKLLEIRDEPFMGELTRTNGARKFNLNSRSRDRITLDIRVILNMLEEK